MAQKKSTSRKGGRRKIGRNLVKCAAYRSAGKREKNRDRRARRIAKGFRRTE